MTTVRGVTGTEQVPLSGWRLCACPPGRYAGLGDLPGDGWIPAPVPGTVARALRASAERIPAELAVAAAAPDEHDWWYRCSFHAEVPPGASARLCFDGLATMAVAWLNGRRVLTGDNMFRPGSAEVAELIRSGPNDLVIHFLALAPWLAARRRPPRWRSRLVAHQNLRWARTTLLGRVPGWSDGPEIIGPWRPVRLEISRLLAVHRADLVSATGPREVTAELDLDAEPLGGRDVVAARLRIGPWSRPLDRIGDTGRRFGLPRAQVRGVERWYPHTHGAQPLYPARVALELGDGTEAAIDLGRVGFREVTLEGDPDDFDLRVNGLDVFMRGACWIPAQPAGAGAGHHAALARLRDMGANMIRISGGTWYESDDFLTCCDELGITVWQDFMFAAMDYPLQDTAFRESVAAEAEQVLAGLAGHPSLALLCGNSEVAQQAAMVGLPPEHWSDDWFASELPRRCSRWVPDVPYRPSSPGGGDLPFHPGRGDAHYYGVGAYLRDVEDAADSGVRFASECLAFANVPEQASLDRRAPGHSQPHHPLWKAGSPRDGGAGWDFDDVRDEYLHRLFGVDPLAVRYSEPDRYLKLSRITTAEMMKRVFALWRAGFGRSRGGLVWFWRDLKPGAGWGVIDVDGRPKAPYYLLRRVWRSPAVALVDRGLNGLRAVAFNDAAQPLDCLLRMTFLPVGGGSAVVAERAAKIAAHGRLETAAESLLGGFRDLNHAYRFGPPNYEIAVAELLDPDTGRTLAEDAYLPGAVADTRPGPVGLEAGLRYDGRDPVLTLTTDRTALWVHVDTAAHVPDDGYFHLVPGRRREVRLLSTGPPAEPFGAVHALNARTPVVFGPG